MKRTELLKKLEAVAESKGLVLELVREGGNHTVYRVGAYQFPVARHREIPEQQPRAPSSRSRRRRDGHVHRKGDKGRQVVVRRDP